jgi:small-conductance mechanosensitive channel
LQPFAIYQPGSDLYLRSLKNEEVVIPNSVILGGEIVNFSSMVSERGLILHTEVGIGYEVPWRQVEAMLLMAAERTPDVLQEPKPFVLQTALGDFAVTYELNVFSKEAEKMAMLYTELHRNIQDVFNEYNIQIMTPHYERDSEEPKLVQMEHWHTAPAIPPQTGS